MSTNSVCNDTLDLQIGLPHVKHVKHDVYGKRQDEISFSPNSMGGCKCSVRHFSVFLKIATSYTVRVINHMC